MKISLWVHANAKQEKIEKTGDNQFVVWVKAQAKEGKANDAVIKALSQYLDISKSHSTILKGHTSKNKLLEIL
jgi:uncharacterized protein YggU (UPF0235/DUF167 family)